MYGQSEKNLLNSNISSRCPHNNNMANFEATNSWHLLAGLGHPSKFQRFSRLGFITAASRRSPEANQTLHDVWPSPRLVHNPIYIFGDFCPLGEFCEVQTSLCVHDLRSPILAALVHGTRPVGVSQTLRRGRLQGMELRNFRRGRHLYSAGQPSR